ncbi:MAG: hypothetical protein B6D37_00745 [Sphingobacteriales bacterium UTBCD1]|jgi:4-amino-4-deoxy-L-arabinose transferase-like glycosyltransferase|nr:MAG: hypothetical protein B6D37_00745 [Sphingobacteriales bacterium UTBCD1]
MRFIKKNIIPVFFIAWLIINLVQAGATELFDDEAYYWVYSRFPAWGYYDHPPMIALMIRIGYSLFHNEFGLRLLVVLFSTASLIIIYDLIPQKNKKLFIAITCSMGILQIGGIIAAPDVPLIFFTALFFWLYRRFLQKETFANALLLGIGMALMMYSKYHGILVIFFTLLSNIRLLKKPLAYMAVLSGIILFVPHLLWQYDHQFPSVQYHLFERSSSGYKFSFTTDYLAGQLLMAGPVMGWLLLWQSFRYKPVDPFERALKFSLAGIYLFFLLTTLKGRVEANWTDPAWVPLIILSSQGLQNKDYWKKVLWRWIPVTLVLVFALRIYMAADISPFKWMPKDEFHDNKVWTAEIKEKAGALPVVFVDTYQKPSKYWFYTGQKAFSLNTPLYRRNNYNFWPLEDSLRGKKVYGVIYSHSAYFTDTISEQGEIIARGKEIDSFYSYSKVNLVPEKNIIVRENYFRSTLKSAFGSELPPAGFTPYLYVYLADTIYGSYKLITNPGSGLWEIQPAENLHLPKGKYTARFAISSAIPNLPSLNSTFCKLTVE